MPPGLRSDQNCIKMLTPIVCCDEHMDEIRPNDILPKESQDRITDILQSLVPGSAAPDFTAVEAEFEPVIDGKPTDLQEMRQLFGSSPDLMVGDRPKYLM